MSDRDLNPDDACPHCNADLSQVGPDGRRGSRRIGVEVPTVYDGVLYWKCPDCGGRWHRWPEGSPYRQRAERYVLGTVPS